MKLTNKCNLIVYLLMFLQLTGCVYYPSKRILNIKELEVEPTGCELIGQVYGNSPYVFLSMGLDIAKDRAKEQAVNIGATHIMWLEIDNRGVPFALGKAYICK